MFFLVHCVFQRPCECMGHPCQECPDEWSVWSLHGSLHRSVHCDVTSQDIPQKTSKSVTQWHGWHGWHWMTLDTMVFGAFFLQILSLIAVVKCGWDWWMALQRGWCEFLDRLNGFYGLELVDCFGFVSACFSCKWLWVLLVFCTIHTMSINVLDESKFSFHQRPATFHSKPCCFTQKFHRVKLRSRKMPQRLQVAESTP